MQEAPWTSQCLRSMSEHPLGVITPVSIFLPLIHPREVVDESPRFTSGGQDGALLIGPEFFVLEYETFGLESF